MSAVKAGMSSAEKAFGKFGFHMPGGGALGIGWGLAMNAVNASMTIDEYKSARQEGANIPWALTKAAATMYMWSNFNVPMMAWTFGNQAAQDIPRRGTIAEASMRNATKPAGQQRYDREVNQSAATMRQRALGLIQNHKQNLRTVLGNEAAIYHQRYG